MGILGLFSSPLAGLAVKLIGAFLDKQKATIETKQAWLDFLEHMVPLGIVAAEYHASYRDQMERLRAADAAVASPAGSPPGGGS